MKRQLIFLCCTLLLVSNCAVMNTAVLETAETVEPGKVKLGMEINSGFDLTSAITVTEDSTATFDEDQLTPFPNFGLKGGIGITDNLELNAKIWFIGGTKVYFKYRFPLSSEKLFLAVAPGFNYIRDKTVEVETQNGETNRDTFYDIRNIGFDVPILFSYHANDFIIFYGTARYGFDVLNVKAEDEWLLPYMLRGEHHLHRMGMVIGISFEFAESYLFYVLESTLYIRPEIGFEGAKRINGDFDTIPIVSLGIGFEM